MRMRYLLEHPEHMTGKRVLLRSVTESQDVGLEIVEHTDPARQRLLGMVLIVFQLAVFVGMRFCGNDGWADAAGIACKCRSLWRDNRTHIRDFSLQRWLVK